MCFSESSLIVAFRGILFYEFVVNFVVNGHRLLLALLQMADEHFFALFLPLCDPVKFRLCVVKFDMGIGVQRDADIRMTHDIL